MTKKAAKTLITMPRFGIRIEDRDAINEFMEQAFGRCNAHTADYGRAVQITEEAEGKLAEIGIPASKRVGAVAFYTGPGASAKAYSYSVNASGFKFRRFKDGWRMVDAEIVQRRPRDRRSLKVTPKVAPQAIAA